MNSTKKKDALDHKGSGTFAAGYSMGILWNIQVDMLERDNARYGTETPLDGDALARGRYQELKLADAWTRLDAAAASRIRNNHHEINRNNR